MNGKDKQTKMQKIYIKEENHNIEKSPENKVARSCRKNGESKNDKG